MPRKLVILPAAERGLSNLPAPITEQVATLLAMIQEGATPHNTKVMRGFSHTVTEIRIREAGEAYRAIYTLAFKDKVYLLHAFHKKSKSGIATPPRELAAIRSRLRDAVRLEAENE